MSDDEPPGAAGAQACAAIAETMIGHFATRLEVEAHKNGGSLTAEAIRALADSFVGADTHRFHPTLQRSWDACTRTREIMRWEQSRTHPFERILVKPFAHLLPPRLGDDGATGLLSRRLLPGFALATAKLLGPALHDECVTTATAITRRHHRPSGGNDWPAIHADAESRTLIERVMLEFARHFAQFERRREWFLDMVNAHLGPGDESDYGWRLTEHGFAEMIRAWGMDMRADMPALRKRHGEHPVEMMEAFLRRLDG